MEVETFVIDGRRSMVNGLIPGLYHTVVVGTVKDDTGSDFCKDQELLRRQHESLIRIFKELNLRVIQVDLHGSYITHFMIDNIAVACNGTVFLPKPRTVVDQKNVSIFFHLPTYIYTFDEKKKSLIVNSNSAQKSLKICLYQ